MRGHEPRRKYIMRHDGFSIINHPNTDRLEIDGVCESAYARRTRMTMLIRVFDA